MINAIQRRALLVAGLIVAAATVVAQPAPWLSAEAHAAQVSEFQRELNAEYRDPAQSPLPPTVLKGFGGLPFYPINYDCYVDATFVRDSTAAPFFMPTSKPRQAPYRKCGELRFSLNGQALHLTVYQNLDLLKKPGYENYLFVPFTDATNGHGTYGGGRYLDLRSPLAASILLDFNRAYNPYCAYSDRYSCPIPPAENHLRGPVPAGVMSDH
ncbi:MAG: DUF1684 domain-containing protein [Hymenobacteraceae bacterium]|nr:DUF1684 domain-containing protein [Hymenobacteraceae bacterium]